MPHIPSHSLFAGLPARRPPWKQFMLSMSTQTVALVALAWVGVLHPGVIMPPVHDYHFIRLVNTPPPVNHLPAPVRLLKPTVVAQVEAPSANALRLPPEPPRSRANGPLPAPKVDVAAKAVDLPQAAPVIPRQLVKTDVFSTGSSAAPTLARAPQQVQTGGFGDPNGVPASQNHGNPLTIAQLGSYALPAGAGYGNGSGGTRGVRGVVASAGFGSGIAAGDNTGRVNASRGTVRQSGFGDSEPVTAAQPRSRPAESATPKLLPAEIISKPTPVYTEEARKLHIEGEVLLEVVFESSGQLRVGRIVRGLGHGLDEAAIQAAEQIRFKPALRDGRPADSTAVLHIVFQLA